MTELKALKGVQIKDAAEGTVQAVFATFNTKDFDGDVTLPDAFDDGAKVRISAYGHASWGPSRGGSFVPMPPVGKGVIRTTPSEAILDGQFFLKTQGGRDTFELVKEMGDLQEWSYGYDIIDSAKGEWEGENVRFLKRQLVHEVSPVLVGAGVGTRTLAVKDAIAFRSTDTTDVAWDGPSNKARLDLDAGADYYRRAYAWVDASADAETKAAYKFIHHEVDGDGNIGAANVAACTTGIAVLNGGRSGTTIPEADRQGVYNHLAGHLRDADREPPPLKAYNLSFPEESEYVLGAITGLFNRVEGWGHESDTKAGRQLSSANRERMTSVVQGMRDVIAGLEQMLAENDQPKQTSDLWAEVLRFERLRANL